MISEYGTTKHDPCINHCLLYAFGACDDELHTQTCNERQELFTFFNNLKEIEIEREFYGKKGGLCIPFWFIQNQTRIAK
jgi:hypothetical protein